MNYAKSFKEFFNVKFPRVRASDPIESFEAADSIKDVASNQYQVILDCLSKHGPLGKDGIAARSKLDSVQVSRRVSEMKAIGLIKLTGNTVKSNSGRTEREWTI